MIYLASPYSHPDPLIVKTRFLLAEQATAILLQRKEWVYSPIVHCHELSQRYELPGDFAYWQGYNIDMLRRCDMLTVLTIPGWRESVGVTAELTVARTLNMPLTQVTPEGEILPWQE